MKRKPHWFSLVLQMCSSGIKCCVLGPTRFQSGLSLLDQECKESDYDNSELVRTWDPFLTKKRPLSKASTLCPRTIVFNTLCLLEHDRLDINGLNAVRTKSENNRIKSNVSEHFSPSNAGASNGTNIKKTVGAFTITAVLGAQNRTPTDSDVGA